MAHSGHEKPIAVIGAIIANAVIAVAKFTVGGITGSSSMLSEGIHSVVDTGNQSLLLLGVKLSRRPANRTHPFGHGKEIYFWGLIVAVLLFGLGGGMSIYEGITHIQHPAELQDPTWNYVVLAVSIVAEGVSFYIATREFMRTMGTGQGVWQGLRGHKDPAVFVVLLEDAAAMAGLGLALLGIFLSHQFNAPWMDGAASIAIGLVLALVAVFLAIESRGLLLGESADTKTVESIQRIARETPGVKQVGYPYTMHFGPQELLVNLQIRFEDHLPETQLVKTMDRIEKAIQQELPQVVHLFLEAESIIESGLDKQAR